MRALIGYIGVIAFILSICGFVVPIFFPSVLAPIAPLLCPEGSSISTATFSRPGETVTNMVCRDVDGIIVEDITPKLLLPLFIMCFGGGFLARFAFRGSASSSAIKVKPSTIHDNDSTVRMDEPQPQIAYKDYDVQPEDRETLSEKLQQLKTALDTGLITQSEYEAKRREMLDEF